MMISPEERVRWQYYRIEPGDSLIRIARKFDTEVALLRAANSIRGSMIRAGDTLMIPMGSGWESSLAMAGGEPQVKGYRVRRGDSLHAIAFNLGLDWRDIARWNNISAPYVIYPDQMLRVAEAPLRAVGNRLADLLKWEPERLNEAVRITAGELDIGMGKIAQPLRVALTGGAVSPSIDKTLWLTGRERSLERIRRALSYVMARAAAM